MKTKFGAIITDGRGKIGGHVASKNRSGAYLRTKVTPVNPRSNDQLTIRNAFTTFSQGWRGLTEAQRAAWNSAVSNYSRTDIFGDLRNPSGINLYQRLNSILATVGVAAISTPPLPSEVPSTVLASFIADISDGSILLTFAPTIPAGSAVVVKATAPMSPGKNFVKSEFRTIGTLAAATVTGEDVSLMYEAKFGTLSNAGQKIFIQFIPVNIATGQVGSPSQASALIIA